MLCIVPTQYMLWKSVWTSEVNSKCRARNTTVQLSTLCIDPEPWNSPLPKFPAQYEEECIHCLAYTVHMWCLCRSCDTVWILYLAYQNFQRCTIGYLSHICTSCLVKKSRAVNETPSQSFGVSLAIWNHNVTCHPTQVDTPCLNPSQRPVLDLPTPEGWKAELSYLTGYISWWFIHTQTVTHDHPSPNLTVPATRLRFELQTVDRKSDTLTTTLLRHLMFLHLWVCSSVVLHLSLSLSVFVCVICILSVCVHVCVCVIVSVSVFFHVMLCAYLSRVQCCARLFGVGSAVVSLLFYFLR